MALKFDRSAETGILITCTLCPYWFSYRFDQCEAYDSAIAHAARAHDEEQEIRRLQDAKYQWRSRNVDTSPDDARRGNPRPVARHL